MIDETNISLLAPSLLEGYGKFRQFKYARHAQRYMQLAVNSQKPNTMVIACCDSRAAPETIFDACAAYSGDGPWALRRH